MSQFFEEVINDSGLDYDTYMKYVFPYLVKYLKKDGYILEKQEDEENGENNKENVDKTVIIVSHRESTLDCVDELIKFV